MRFLRAFLSVASLLLLAAGYVASQAAFFGGQAPEYAARVDSPAVKLLALAIVVAAVVLALIPASPEEEQP